MTEVGSDERLSRVADAVQIMAKVLVERERVSAEEARLVAENRIVHRDSQD